MENNDLRTLFQLMVRRYGLLNERCCESCCGQDISLVQSHILFEITRREQPSMQEVANTLGLDITTFSRQIKSLVEKGYVQKVPHPDDHRVKLLSLTEKGKKLEEQIDQEMNDNLNEILSHLSEYERESVIRSVELLNKAMRRAERFTIL